MFELSTALPEGLCTTLNIQPANACHVSKSFMYSLLTTIQIIVPQILIDAKTYALSTVVPLSLHVGLDA